jgi:two-component system chemotaxis response regulator CheB
MTDSDEAPGVVAVGASAGGVEALTRLTAGLTPDLPYAVVVVLHMPADAPSVLARILARAGPLPATPALTGAALEPGNIYVAVPGRHLLVRDHQTLLTEGPTENGHRPAINALFRSAALTFGPRTIGVLLSGVLDDGVLGSAAIRSRGGTTIAQTPSDALFPSMPQNAVDAGVIDHQADAAGMGGLIEQLAERVIEEREMEPDNALELENRIALAKPFSTDFDTEALGPPSGDVCPDCNGPLAAIGKGSYRCRVGHAWTAGALLWARDREVEEALWVALRSLEEKAKLSRHLAEKAGRGQLVDRYREAAEDAEHAAAVLSGRLSAITHSGDRGG